MVGQAFHNRFGAPSPATEVGFHFSRSWHELGWKPLAGEIGAGHFMDGFLYLWGEGIGALDSILEQWAFLLPDAKNRRVVGINAHGVLLVTEEEATAGMASRVGVLSPLLLTYTTSGDRLFGNTIGNYLPEGKLTHFLDDTVYRAWKTPASPLLLPDQILAAREPYVLGGAADPDNFQVEPTVDYFSTTAPIYRKLNRSRDRTE